MPTNLTGSFVDQTFNQLLHVDGGPAATEKTVYSGTGTPTALKLGTISASVENINFNGNTIATNDANGNLFLTPNGSGAVVITKVNILGGSLSGITDLAITDGGTGASDAAGARTNLGLGTLATQDASAVNITGGTIANATFTGSVSVTTLTATTINGTATNGGNLRMQGNILSSTDTDGNIALQPNGAGLVTFPTLTGTNVNATTVNATTFDTNVAAAGVTLAGTTLAADGTDADINITLTPKGTGVVTTPALRSTGSLGYATGAGGTVTQLTSKSTGVTLNKLVGQIVTHDESMSNGSSVSFTVTNSLVGANDVVVIHRASGGTGGGVYHVFVDAIAAGSFVVHLHNDHGGTLAEAITLNFAVIKGVVA